MSKLKTHIFIFLLCIGLVFSFSLRGQDHIQFKNYTINDGLSQSSISCILQDGIGSLWIGTQDGINRFNGKNFEVFSSDKGYDISNEFINVGYKDSKGNMWFGTKNGLTKHNPLLVQFTAHTIENKKLDITAIEEDKDGNLWIGTFFGEIYKYNNKKQSFKLVDNNVFSSKINSIRLRNNQLVIVSDFEGILISDNEFKQKKIVEFGANYDDFSILGLIENREYDIVVSTNKGIFYYDDNIKLFVPISGLFGAIADKNIVDITYLSKNKILAASDNSGLYQVTRNEKDSIIILNYSSDIFQKGSLLSNKLTGIFKDNQGVIWLTSDQGLSSFNPNYIGFMGVGISAQPNNGLPSSNVWGFAESDNEQYLFIAADHGISSYDRIHHKYYHYPRGSIQNEDYTALNVYYINDNKLLVACIDGLFELTIDATNRNNFKYKKLNHQDESLRGFDLSYIIVPFKNDNQFLIGTRRGISLFDYDNLDFYYLYNQPDDPNTIGPGSVRFIFENEGKYYASPSGGNIYEITFENNILKANSDNEFKTLNNASSYFYSVLKDKNGIFWFGTAGDGLIKYDLLNKVYVRFDKSKGLPNNVIYGVKTSTIKSNYIWLSTNKGLVAFNILNEQFFNFTEKDGLMSNELNLGANFAAKNGDLYFGGIQGFNYFDPAKAFYSNKNIRVYFSSLEVDNQLILPSENGLITQNIAFTKHIRLPYNKKSLRLRFFANDLGNPDRIEFKYVLKGKNDIEEELGTSNELRFPSLSPGVYVIQVYARSSNGNWNNYPAEITVELEKPFWAKWWFYVICVLIISLFFMYRVRRRIEEGRRRQVRLEMKIAERTRELRKKNEQIQLQSNRLIQQTEELEREKEKSERLLNNVLPKETASQLKKDGRAAARDFKKVSIIFTDFVGFSKIAEDMSAKDLVSILDMHFRKFDDIIENNNLEKIKTIGDAYMAAGGVPIRNKTNPINTALAGVQIKYYMLQHKASQIAKGEPYWKLRIGINTGSVSAGVIGSKRYAYDIWGSAVNRAQRMEQLCEPEKIAISQDTFDYIEPYFECQKIGKIKTKSGVKIMMYELISIKPELSIDGLGIEPNEAFHKLVNLHHFSKINYSKAERFVMDKLKKELSSKLHYHSAEHSKDVTRQAERIAISEGITDEDLFLLKSAASYHDAGFIEQYEHNEPIGARMAAEILPKFGYTYSDIQRIKELIYVTSVPHKPKNRLEEIICDADLDYLGRDDFHEIADRLRLELREHGKIDSDRKWDEIQVKFLEQHRYFTRTSIETRRPKKLKHLEEIKQKLKTFNYVD